MRERAHGGFREQRKRRDRVRWHVCCDMAQIGIHVSVRYLGSTVELETHLGLSGHPTLMYLNVV